MNSHWLIWSIEHGAWWKPNWKGYTENRAEAGRYSFEEACKIVSQANIGNHNVPNEAMIQALMDDGCEERPMTEGEAEIARGLDEFLSSPDPEDITSEPSIDLENKIEKGTGNE